MIQQSKISLCLLLLRLSVFTVMFMWTLDKFIRPNHATAVYESFYFLGVGTTIIYLLGAIELIILIGFVIGYRKTLTYGAVLLFHAVSTLSAFGLYLTPFESNNLLFYAAWPMLAACFTLFYLRDLDNKWTVKEPRKSKESTYREPISPS